MKLRNKQTGEVADFKIIADYDDCTSGWRLEKQDGSVLFYDYIDEIKEEWEDYKPAEPTRWRPEKFQNYYHVGGDGFVYSDTWTNGSAVDNGRFEIGNCFQTEEEAERVREYLKALAAVRGDATGEFVKYNDNWFVGYDPEHKSIGAFCNPYTARNGIFALPYFATEEDAQRSIKLHKNEWLTIFGVKE